MKTTNSLHIVVALMAWGVCHANTLAHDAVQINEQQPAPAQRSSVEALNIIGTWSRVDGQGPSKLTIRPVENRELLFFVESDEWKGLLEWRGSQGNYQGSFSLPLLGDRWAHASMQLGPNGTGRISVTPFSSDWKRVESTLPPETTQTVAVVKTEYDPLRVRDKLRAKYFDDRYLFLSDVILKSVIVLAPAESQEDIEAFIHQLDVAETLRRSARSSLNSNSSSPTVAPTAAPNATIASDTPASRQLLEQLRAQESAAAEVAAMIRQLQANGETDQNKSAIGEHQRILKGLLSTAFDLKLQWEELQVKELQARLSQLDRQIGQRKQLREKIIARRASELIEEDMLKWDASGINTTRPKATRITINQTTLAPSTLATPPAALHTMKASDDERIWRILGLRLEQAPIAKLNSVDNQYRGGMTVLDTRPDGPAARQGIRQDDILVGLHHWETASPENVVFVLDRADLAAQTPLKFFLLRGEETLFGYLLLDGPN